MSRHIIRRSHFAAVRVRRLTYISHSAGLKPRRVATSVPGINRTTLSGLSRSNVICVNTRIANNSVLINGMAPGNRARLAPRRGLLHTVFNRGTSSIGSSSLHMPGNMSNAIVSIRIFAHSNMRGSGHTLRVRRVRLGRTGGSLSRRLRVLRTNLFDHVHTILMTNNIRTRGLSGLPHSH